MKKATCINTRKASAVMRTFLNQASDLYTKGYHYPIEAIKFDEDGNVIYKDETQRTPITRKTKIHLTKKNHFCALVPHDNVRCDSILNLIIHYNFENLFDDGTKIFRAYWTHKCPMLKGFSDVTLALLHELGHLETIDELHENGYSKFERMETLLYISDSGKGNTTLQNFMYFNMTDEKAATYWAIEWLSDPEHRKLAKKFEKQFFACFA